MILSSKTDIGAHRESNQDAFYTDIFKDGVTWAVVCDGMGGVSGGQIASRICIEKVKDTLVHGYREGMTVKSARNLLESSIYAANSAVFETAQKDSNLIGMGTTVVVAIMFEKISIIAHVGDSRAYLINNNIQQITKDHSLVQMMIDSGKITEEEAKVHPDRNVITRAVGVLNVIDVETDIIDLEKNDKLLLCTDGLTGSVESEDILKIINDYGDSSTEKLVETAIAQGSHDNITAVLIDANIQGE